VRLKESNALVGEFKKQLRAVSTRYVCVCVYVCIYVCVCVYVCIYVCMCVSMYVCMYVCMCGGVQEATQGCVH
jgi:hypothetical protein